MEENTFIYKIDGKTYVQTPLVLGQLRQLLDALKDTRIPADANAAMLLAALSGHLSGVLAVILTPEGMTLKEKNLTEISEDLSFSVHLSTALQVIEDFFICNPISSLLERLTGLMEKAAGKKQEGGQAHRQVTGLKSWPSSSAEETSPGETPSSGILP